MTETNTAAPQGPASRFAAGAASRDKPSCLPSSVPEQPLEKPLVGGRHPPPVETRFKPGQSGNPSGKGKDRWLKLRTTAVERVMARRRPVEVDGELQPMSMAEAVLTMMGDRAIGGDAAAAREFVRVMGEAEQARADEAVLAARREERRYQQRKRREAERARAARVAAASGLAMGAAMGLGAADVPGGDLGDDDWIEVADRVDEADMVDVLSALGLVVEDAAGIPRLSGWALRAARVHDPDLWSRLSARGRSILLDVLEPGARAEHADAAAQAKETGHGG